MPRLRYNMPITEWKQEICSDSEDKFCPKAMETCETMISGLKKFNVKETILLDFLDQAEIYGPFIIQFWKRCKENPETLYNFIIRGGKIYDYKYVIEEISKKRYDNYIQDIARIPLNILAI
mgnify:FL=1